MIGMRSLHTIMLLSVIILGSVVLAPIITAAPGSGPPINIPNPKIPERKYSHWNKLREGEYQYRDFKLVVGENVATVFVNNTKFVEIYNIKGVLFDRNSKFISIRGSFPSDLLNIYALEPIRITGNIVDLRVKIYFESLNKIKGRIISGEIGNYNIMAILKDYKREDNIIEPHGPLMISIVRKGGVSFPFARLPEAIAEKSIEKLSSYIIIRRINNMLSVENLTITTPIRSTVIKEDNDRLRIGVFSDTHLRNVIIALELSEFAKKKVKGIILDDVTPMVRVRDFASLLEIPGSYMIVLSDNVPIVLIHLPHMSGHTITIIFETLEKIMIRYGAIAGLTLSVTMIAALIIISRKH